MEDIFAQTKSLMKRYNILANKNLGQNFLVDSETVSQIVSSANITKQDLIIEIGPGLGTLTSSLVEKAGKVIAIELDKRMLTILNDRFGNLQNFEVINDDILKIDIKKLIQDKKEQCTNIKIVANLPYYITTPIIMKLLEEKLAIQSIVVMVQKEVAERITAIPGSKNSGAITYSVYYYADTSQICFVSRNSFIPAPEVDSAVIKLDIRKNPQVDVKNEEMFFKVIKSSFMQRRKTLLNALVNGNIVKDKEIGKKLLEEMNLQVDVRGEALSIEQFAELTNKIEKVL